MEVDNSGDLNEKLPDDRTLSTLNMYAQIGASRFSYLFAEYNRSFGDRQTNGLTDEHTAR